MGLCRRGVDKLEENGMSTMDGRGRETVQARDAERVVIERADVVDAQAILDLQKLAYLSEAAIYDDYTLPPLTQTLEGVVADFARHVVLKASLDGRLVGSVRGRLDGATCFVARLIVHPDVQDRGIGTALMRQLEQRFPEAERFELFTGVLSERPLHLYDKLGYRAIRTERQTDKVDIVFLEKPRESSRPAE
jgi:ribosomal protein S18 acetylase RimI-like enzyme